MLLFDMALLPFAIAASGGVPATKHALQPAASMTTGTRAGAGAYVHGPSGGSAAAYEAYVNAGYAASPAACSEAGFTETFRDNCLLRHDPRKRQELLDSLSGCTWVKLPDTSPLSVTHQGTAPTPSEQNPYSGTVAAERCMHDSQTSLAADDSDDSLGSFYAVRAGPVTTHGGKDWTSFTLSNLTGSAIFGTTGDSITFAAREQYAGAISVDGTLLSYPPIHQHHFHITEEREMRNDLTSHAVITHGDDVCRSEDGGVDCTIRRMAPGYATLLRMPLLFSADMNDVRATGSDGLSYYLLVTLRGAPPKGEFKAFTEMRLNVYPTDCVSGYFGTYLIPANRLLLFWKESTWWRSATLLNAYVHTHPQWMEDILLYSGSSGARVGMHSLNVSHRLMEASRASVEHIKQQVAERSKAAGASLVCRYRRNKDLVEVVEGTAELNDMYYRLSAGCVPFRMTDGEPFFYLAIISPDSEGAAASTGGSLAYPDEPLVGQHTWFRLFVNFEDVGVDTANCDQGCGYDLRLSNGVMPMVLGCAKYNGDGQGATTTPLTCAAGTEVRSPPIPSCTRNETMKSALVEFHHYLDYPGNPRQYGRAHATRLSVAGAGAE
jgi:hypothetical protein